MTYKSQSLKTAYVFLLHFFLFCHWFKWNDSNQSTLSRNSWTFIQTFLRLRNIPLNAKKFITPVLVYEMKYLLKCQYWNYQFCISLTLMAHLHKMLKTYNDKSVSSLKICSITMFTVNNIHIWWMQLSLYVSPNFQTYGVLTIKTSDLQRLVISVHMSFLQLNSIESVTTQFLWLIKLQVVLTRVVIKTLCLLHYYCIVYVKTN